MTSLFRRRSHLPDAVYIDLVQSLFASVRPSVIMGALFIMVAGLAARHHTDQILIGLAWVGGLLSITRITVVALGGRLVVAQPASVASVQRAERLFAVTYLLFAIVLGLFSARAISVCDQDVQTVVAALVVGYAAGVAAGVSLRPWISVPAVLAAVLPTAAATSIVGDSTHAALAVVLIVLLAGGLGSMLDRYRSVVEKTALRQKFSLLARTDHLTGLANRLTLAETFEQEVETCGYATVAVHCLDLDQFKPVNDLHGHPVGDVLLTLVGERLRALCRRSDLAARLGGDEFVLLQTRIGHGDEAHLLARRIVRVLAEPYDIEGHRIVIGASVGFALPEAGDNDLEELLKRADEALYRAKRGGGGAANRSWVDSAKLAAFAS